MFRNILHFNEKDSYVPRTIGVRLFPMLVHLRNSSADPTVNFRISGFKTNLRFSWVRHSLNVFRAIKMPESWLSLVVGWVGYCFFQEASHLHLVSGKTNVICGSARCGGNARYLSRALSRRS